MIIDVAIVGLGPVGATLANLLACHGLSVVVLEREADVYPLPRAVQFDGECMRVFDSIGISRELDEHCITSPGMRFVNEHGKLLVDWPRPAGIGNQGWCSSYRFHQPDLEKILRKRLADHSKVQVYFKCEVFSLEQHPEYVTVHYENTRQGTLHQINARYIVGCDGARSIVRRFIGSEMEDLGCHERWLVFDVLLKQPWNVLGEHSVQFCDPKRPATYVRGVGNRRRWEIMLHPNESAAEITHPDKVWSLLEKWIQPKDADLERAAVYTFHALIAKQWRNKRLLLAGDAAHQTPPFLGQGMCAGIRDAANLAWKLNAVIHESVDEDLLQSYQAERHPHVAEFIKLAVELGQIIQAVDTQSIIKREEMFANGPRILQSLNPVLGLSSFSTQHQHFGKISHQPTLANGKRLDLIKNRKFMFLSRPNFGLLKEMKNFNIDLERLIFLEDDSPTTLAWLDELNVHAVLIRPDCYIQGAIKNLTELDALIQPIQHLLCNPHSN